MKQLGLTLLLIVLGAGLLVAQNDNDDYTMRCGPMGFGMGYGIMGHGMMHGMASPGMGDHLIVQLCHFGCPGFILQLSEELDLSDNQIRDLKTIMNEYEKYATKKKADIRVEKIELSELLDMSAPDFENVRNKVDTIAEIEKELRVRFLLAIENSREVLNDEQLTQLNTLELQKKGQQRGRGMRWQ